MKESTPRCLVRWWELLR